MTESPFTKPSEAPQGGSGVADLEGALCIFAFRGRGEAMTTSYGVKQYVATDVIVVEGNAGGKGTPTKLGDTPRDLELKPGDEIEDVRLFQGFIRGYFRGQVEGGLVLGTPYVSWEDTQQGKNQPVWRLKDPDEAQVAAAQAALQRKLSRQMSSPSAAQAVPAPAPAVDAEPDF